MRDTYVIPGLTKPALACPVLDAEDLIRGNPVITRVVPECFNRASRD